MGVVIVMQVIQQGSEGCSSMTVGDELKKNWLDRLASESPELSHASAIAIVDWLLGSDTERFENLAPKDLQIAKQAMEYRWKILRQRYLGVSREKAYRNLITRLGSLAILRSKIQTWISLSRDRQRAVLDVLSEVLQELLQSDNYMQQQMAYIATLTKDGRLNNALLFASAEEYCLRPVRNQPLLVYRCINYLKRTQRGGLTQVPGSDMVRLVSEEILTDDSDNRVSLLDTQVVEEYQEAQEQEEQQALRQMTQEKFEAYLQEKLGEDTVNWLRLYLQGKSQNEIAKKLNLSSAIVYRLREKISYHAVNVFSIKEQPEMVQNWLGISLEEHNMGLTQNQLQGLNQKLTPKQRQIMDSYSSGQKFEEIAVQLKMKPHQVLGEWTKIYTLAQEMRNKA
ncbi:MAG: HetZ-related protein 2 [Scytonematopsis contorta HA4267-MV1]|jgi:DNA-binding CsgD family transcriptional regulator|nr:HetZ-related protein 2 [Scytonematopsis contorta HA4267-MV1]